MYTTKKKENKMNIINNNSIYSSIAYQLLKKKINERLAKQI